MKKLESVALHLIGAVRKHHRIVILVASIAMFVLAASAPNATIGIGK